MSTAPSSSNPSHSLSSVVSNLVRAQMGTSLAPTVTDEDLDRHVAELILKEAKKKVERYGQQGIRALISNNIGDGNAPRPNKRFLTSIIKSTDEHNKTVLRAQALAAEEVKRERAEQEKLERRKRAQEAVEAEKLRRSAGQRSSRRHHYHRVDSYSNEHKERPSSRSTSRRRRGNEDEGWDRWDGRTAERKRKVRDWATWKGGDDEEECSEGEDRRRSTKRRRASYSSRSRSRNRDNERDRHSRKRSPRRTTRDDNYETPTRKLKRDRDRSQSPRGKRTSDETATSYRRRDRSRDHNDTRYRRRSHSPSSSSRTARSESPKRRSRREPSSKCALDDLPDDMPSRSSSSPHPSSSVQQKGTATNATVINNNAEEDPEQTSTHESDRKPRDRHTSPERTTKSKRRRRSPSSTGSILSSSSHSHSHRRHRRAPPSHSRSRSPTPGPHQPKQLPSKMDKYFEESYDPRLDVAPLSAPNVPATGLISDAEFAGWDAMLELLRVRQQDKEDRKALERLGLSTKDRKKSKTVPSSTADVAARWGEQGSSILDIEYTKRGSVREWDLGKAGF